LPVEGDESLPFGAAGAVVGQEGVVAQSPDGDAADVPVGDVAADVGVKRLKL
jgi:hypothetical protein